MRRRLRLQLEWEIALDSAEGLLDARGDRLLEGLPAACPFTLDHFIAQRFDLPAALDRLLHRP